MLINLRFCCKTKKELGSAVQSSGEKLCYVSASASGTFCPSPGQAKRKDILVEMHHPPTHPCHQSASAPWTVSPGLEENLQQLDSAGTPKYLEHPLRAQQEALWHQVGGKASFMLPEPTFVHSHSQMLVISLTPCTPYMLGKFARVSLMPRKTTQENNEHPRPGSGMGEK